MTSVAASSTTGYPLTSSRRRMAVFPAPGAPVRTYDGMAKSSRADCAAGEQAESPPGRRMRLAGGGYLMSWPDGNREQAARSAGPRPAYVRGEAPPPAPPPPRAVRGAHAGGGSGAAPPRARG